MYRTGERMKVHDKEYYYLEKSVLYSSVGNHIVIYLIVIYLNIHRFTLFSIENYIVKVPSLFKLQ